MTMISDFTTAGKNSFGLIRLIAAITVIFSHAYIIVGSMSVLQPLEGLTGYPLGAHAVHAFFTISGLLVTASLDRQTNITAFVAARFFRIYPGLVVAAVLAFIGLVAFVSTAPMSEIVARSGVSYFAKILIALTGSSTIPGVFEAMPLKGEVNVPIWTLKYEVVCYVTLIAMVFLVRRTKLVTPLQASATIACLAGAWMLRGLAYNDAHIVDHIARFSFSFWVGAMAWYLRDKIAMRYDVLATLAVLTIVSMYFHLIVLPHFLIVTTGYAALMLGQYRYGFMSTFTDRNDLSYGVYIYGWPIQQTLLLHNPTLTPIPLALIALVIVLPIGYISWRFIEKPALRLKDRFE
jgi:peptidoglycan/LPS O-acetylase OafA/YrhL